MPWDKPFSGLMREIENDFSEESRDTALYALGDLQRNTPVGDPSTWQNPDSAPKGYVGGTLRRSWDMDRLKNGWFVGSDQDYAEAIWQDGHSKRLAEGAIDRLVASLSTKP